MCATDKRITGTRTSRLLLNFVSRPMNHQRTTVNRTCPDDAFTGRSTSVNEARLDGGPMFRGRPLLHAVNDIDGQRACTEGTPKRRATFTKFQVSSKSQVRSRRSWDGANINSASKIPRRLASTTYNPISEENDRNSLPNSPIQSLSEPPWFSCKLQYLAARVHFRSCSPISRRIPRPTI